VLSGKGGTGKTTVSSALIKLSEAKAYADCDVDAPNLHLIMSHTEVSKNRDFYGLPKAAINQKICIQCDLCRKMCQFDAVEKINNSYCIHDLACEGCGVCEMICPVRAITLKPSVVGDLMLYQNGSVFSTAKIRMGSGNSGKLVTAVKQELKAVAPQASFAIIDGSPGIGCPVIASLSGVDMVLIVAEPSVTGISDMKRIIATANQFLTPIAVCINKYDVNTIQTKRIEVYCRQHHISIIGYIPYDTEVVQAVNRNQSIIDIDCKAGSAVRKMFGIIEPFLKHTIRTKESKNE